MSEKSYSIAKEKFKRDIGEIIAKVNVGGTNVLTIEVLGELIYLLGIYKILFNEKHRAHSRLTSGPISCDNSCNHSDTFLLRQAKENEFHINLWKFLTNSEYVSASIVKDMLLLLFDSGSTSLKILSNQLNCIINLSILVLLTTNPYAPKKGIDYDEIWSSAQVITAFKELKASPFLISNTNLLREKEKKVMNFYPFAPSINSKSQVLDEMQLKKYDLPFDELSNELSIIS